MKTRHPLYSALIAFALVLFSLAACKPKTESELGEPFDKIAGLSGTWELNRFIQQDLNNPIREQRDLSQFYLQEGIEPLRVTFNGESRTYEVAIETGRNYFGENGTWRFDDPMYPTTLTLTTLVDDIETELDFKLGRMVREFDQNLVIELQRGCNLGSTEAIPTVIYRFEFNRLNN